MPTERSQAAARARARKLEEQKRQREAARLAEHNAATARTEEAIRTRRVMGVKRRVAPPPESPERQRVAWWCRPEIRKILRAQEEENEARRALLPHHCPHCGGERIRPQQWRADGTSLWHCPIDYTKTFLGTGCDYRWLWDGEHVVRGSKPLTEPRTAFIPARMGQNAETDYEAPENDDADIFT